jgi:hypothetical protein
MPSPLKEHRTKAISTEKRDASFRTVLPLCRPEEQTTARASDDTFFFHLERKADVAQTQLFNK